MPCEDCQKLQRKLISVIDRLKFHANSDAGLAMELSVLVTDRTSPASTWTEAEKARAIASQRGAVTPSKATPEGWYKSVLQNGLEEQQRLWLQELGAAQQRQYVRRRSDIAQRFAAAMLREDNLSWDEITCRAFDAADAFLATERKSK